MSFFFRRQWWRISSKHLNVATLTGITGILAVVTMVTFLKGTAISWAVQVAQSVVNLKTHRDKLIILCSKCHSLTFTDASH